MATKSAGEEGFRWFIGVVEDRDDPELQGRVRVRIYNVHGDDVETPTDTLPWAVILMPGFSSSLKQVGVSATGLQVGSTVVGFFMDGNESLLPAIFGAFPGKDDIPKLAANQNTIEKQVVGPEPATAYQAKYPYNKVTQTESGHVFEIDDTPNFERLHSYHKSGTYTEIDHEGRRVNKIVGDDYEVVVKDQKIFVKGNMDVEVQGNQTVLIKGNQNITVEGNVNLTVKGNMTSKVSGTYDLNIGSTCNITSAGAMTLKGSPINLN